MTCCPGLTRPGRGSRQRSPACHFCQRRTGLPDNRLWRRRAFHRTGRGGHRARALSLPQPFIEGMAKALTGIEENGLANVRLWMDEPRAPHGQPHRTHSASGLHACFPDPWPKKKQQKRAPGPARTFLMTPPQSSRRARRSVSATVLQAMPTKPLPAFSPIWRFLPGRPSVRGDWRNTARRPCAETRYEAKRLGDCEPVWLDFRV